MIPQDNAFAEIKSSATLSLGTIEHANFSGYLENATVTLSIKKHLWEIQTYATIPLRTVTSPLTVISLPLSSFALVTLNAERTEAITMNSVASTK